MSVALKVTREQSSRHEVQPLRTVDEPGKDRNAAVGESWEIAGDWLQYIAAVPRLDGSSAEELLRRSAAELPGNLRYGWDGLRVQLFGEVPLHRDSANPVGDAERRLHRMLSDKLGDSSAGNCDEESLATELCESGFAFEKRERGWVLPAREGTPEVTLLQGPGGTWAECVLSTSDALSDVSRSAIALFLCRAHRLHRFVRFVLNESDVRATSFAEACWFELDLARSVQAVLSAANEVPKSGSRAGFAGACGGLSR
jgi:hypothetical protein